MPQTGTARTPLKRVVNGHAANSGNDMSRGGSYERPAVLARLKEAGVSVSVADGKLKLKGPQAAAERRHSE